MKSIAILIATCLLHQLGIAQVENKESPFTYFFSPRPVNDDRLLRQKDHWDFKPTVHIPAIKLVRSTRQDAEIDARFLASIGGGVTLQHSIQENGENYALFGLSLFLLLSGDTSNKDAVLDPAAAITANGFNNLLQAGFGWDLGTVTGRPRGFILLSLGINVTNN